jgi:hypothetical protein
MWVRQGRCRCGRNWTLKEVMFPPGMKFRPHQLPPNMPGLEQAGYMDHPGRWRQLE